MYRKLYALVGVLLLGIIRSPEAISADGNFLDPLNQGSVIEKIQRYSLQIKSNVTVSAYNRSGSGTASGFLLGINLEGEALGVTNRHVISEGNGGKYIANTVDGKEYTIQLIYSHPTMDYAFFAVAGLKTD